MNIQTLIWQAELSTTRAKANYVNGKIGDAAEDLAGLSVLIQDHLQGCKEAENISEPTNAPSKTEQE